MPRRKPDELSRQEMMEMHKRRTEYVHFMRENCEETREYIGVDRVYFIQVEGYGPIKIGYSKQGVRKRMHALQTASPWDLVLIGHIDGSELTESSWHEKFSKFRMRGEWFWPDPELVTAIREAIQKDQEHRW